MKKIKRLSQLHKERQRLAVQRGEQEKQMRSDWQDIRRSIAPATLLRHALFSGADWIRERWFNKKR